MEGSHEQVAAVLDRRLVGKGQLHGVLRLLIYIGEVRALFEGCDVADVERCVGVHHRPAEALAAKSHLLHTLAHEGVVAVEDKGLCIAEKAEFLPALLLDAGKVLLMGRTDIGHDAEGRLDDGAQGFHLTRLGDARFKQARLALLVEEPHAEGHTDLRIVGAGAAGDAQGGRQHLIEPFLHHGLAVAARDADDGQVVFFAVALSEALQSAQG